MNANPSIRPLTIVVTRFNVVFQAAHFAKDRTGSPTRTDEWLKRRFELFEGICLPSLEQQTDKGFHWLVFFSDVTPAAYVDRTKAIQRKFPQFIPVFVDSGENVVHRLRSEVKALADPRDTHVITMRIDNDDAYHKEMVERVKGAMSGNDDEFLNFPTGLQCDIDHGLISKAYELSNAFIVRAERIKEGDARTVLGLLHRQAQETGLLRDVAAPPMWLQVIHGNNVINEMGAGALQFQVDLQHDFGVVYPFKIDRMRTFLLLVRRFVGRLRGRVRA